MTTRRAILRLCQCRIMRRIVARTIPNMRTGHSTASDRRRTVPWYSASSSASKVEKKVYSLWISRFGLHVPVGLLVGSGGNVPLLHKSPSQHSIEYRLFSASFSLFPSNDFVLQYKTTCSRLVVQPFDTYSSPFVSLIRDFQHWKRNLLIARTYRLKDSGNSPGRHRGKWTVRNNRAVRRSDTDNGDPRETNWYSSRKGRTKRFRREGVCLLRLLRDCWRKSSADGREGNSKTRDLNHWAKIEKQFRTFLGFKIVGKLMGYLHWSHHVHPNQKHSETKKNRTNATGVKSLEIVAASF